MKTHFTSIVLLLMLPVALAGCAQLTSSTQTDSTPKISASDVFAQVTTENGAVYMTLKNEGQSDDALVEGSTDAAKSVELHESKIGENDVMQMRHVSKIPLPAGGSVTFQPGGLHMMLVDLQKELAPGDKISLTLTFEKTGPITVEAEVREGSTMGQMEH